MMQSMFSAPIDSCLLTSASPAVQAPSRTPASSCASIVSLTNCLHCFMNSSCSILEADLCGTVLGFTYENPILRSSLRRVRGLQCFFSFFVMTSAIMLRSHAPCSNPYLIGGWRSVFLTISISSGPSIHLAPGGFLSDMLSSPRSCTLQSHSRTVEYGRISRSRICVCSR